MTKLNPSSAFPFVFALLFGLPSPASAAGLLEDGDDFSNNLVSDLAPLLALFGERVTTQFMSQSTGWADCIALAMAPIGVITIIISAIRVAGHRILKATIGRARENVATVELEVMSSTSPEVCELWNSQTQAVVRCAGTTDNCELICIYPKSMIGKKIDKSALRVKVMETEKAIAQGDRESDGNGSYHCLKKVGPSKDVTEQPIIPIEEPTTIVITRNPKNTAPNMTLNCTGDRDRLQVRICAAVGIVIQTGVLVFFGFLTRYNKLKFDKDGSPVENYAMPMAVLGTMAVNVGILICAHVVDESSTEETYETINKDSAAIAMVWLQKEKTVSDQRFDSAVVYPTATRHQARISKRIDGNGKAQFSMLAYRFPSNTLRLEIMTSMGALISVLGFVVQFIGLRGMHWLASIAQLAAVIAMTILRAIIRRHLASGLTGHDLKVLTGFELEWFIASLVENERISWVPGYIQRQNEDDGPKGITADEGEQAGSKPSGFKWIVRTGDAEGVKGLSPFAEAKELVNRDFQQVSDLTSPHSILNLRRHLGELSEWHSPVSKEALAVAQAIEKTMNFFMPFADFDMGQNSNEDDIETALALVDDDVSLSTIDSTGGLDKDYESYSEHGLAMGNDVKQREKLITPLNWSFKVGYSRGQQGGSHCNQDNAVHIKLQRSANDVWSAPVDTIDAALSLWLFSTKEHRIRDAPGGNFPCGSDQWIRGDLLQKEKGLRILGPSAHLLLRDLNWWIPHGLDGILEAEMKQSSDNKEDFPQSVRKKRIGAAGEGWYSSPANIYAKFPLPKASILDCDDEIITHWRWQPAEKAAYHETDEHKPGEGTQRPPSQLVAESQDPLHVLQAKDLFSSFLWSMASFLGKSAVSGKLEANVTTHKSKGIDPWKNCSLQSREISQLVQSIAQIGLWTEWEVWASLIPPLSATDNLPGLESLMQLVMVEGAQFEKAERWEKAKAAYQWLFDISSLSLPESHVRVKSRAIVWRFCERVRIANHIGAFSVYSPSPVKGVTTAFKKEEQDQEGFYIRLENVFNLHQRLEHLRYRPRQNLDLEFDKGPYLCLETGSILYEGLQKQVDIFGRTHLHHNMQSSFVDHDCLEGDAFEWWFLPLNNKDLQLYRKRIAAAVKAGRRLKFHPMLPLDHIFWAIFFPTQTSTIILGHGADPNAQDLDGLTPLHYVCRSVRQDELSYSANRYHRGRDQERVQVLLDNKADINAQDLQRNTPLHLAVSSGREDLVAILLQNRCKLNLCNLGGWTPLHIAVAAQNEGVVKTLLKHGAKQDVLDRQRKAPLGLAASLGFLPMVELLYDDYGLSDGILEADKSGAFDVVDWLLEKVTIDAWPPKDKHGTLFYHASARQRPELIARLLQWEKQHNFRPGGVLEKGTGGTALTAAADNGDLRVVQVLAENVEPEIWMKLLEETDGDGRTPLRISAHGDHPEVFSYLLDHCIERIDGTNWASCLESMLEERNEWRKALIDLQTMGGYFETTRLIGERLKKLQRLENDRVGDVV